jgi:hypothetical protein
MRLKSWSCRRASVTSRIRNDRHGANKAQIEGPESATFRHLCDIYSGNVYHQPLLLVLERGGAVCRVGHSKVRSVRRTPVADGPRADCLVAIGEVAGALLATFDYNFVVGPEESFPVGHCVATVNAAAMPMVRRQFMRRTEARSGA